MMREQLLAKRDLIEDFLRSRTRHLSCLSFANLFLWQDFFEFEFSEIDGNLCVSATSEPGTFLYFPPLGKTISPVALQQCFRNMRERNRGCGVTRIDNVPVGDLRFFPDEEYSFFHKGYEYLYYRADVAGLSGQEYKSRRHDRHVFERRHHAEYLPFIPDMQPQCVALYDQWAVQRRSTHADEVYRQMLDENRTVHALGMHYYRELGLTGRVVTIDGKICAYTFGYELTPEIFCVLFEVADLNYNGLSAYVFTQFCRDEDVERYKFINVMDDFGMKDLGQVKMSFRPTALVPAYTVSEKNKNHL